MFVLSAETADDLWRQAIELLLSSEARHQDGRNGPTREIMRVTFELTNPLHRWIMSRLPPIKPAFAIAEVIWMVNGRNDAAFLNYWNRQLPKFVGSDASYYGAYGHRIRSHFNLDQLSRAAEVLKTDPNCRQVVLQLWDVKSDLPAPDASPQNKDIPCNVMSILKIRERCLDWLQISRSNDFFRGIPYNFVQFTCLQEIAAGWIGASVGVYTHISDSLHIYENDLKEVSVTNTAGYIKNTDSLALDKKASNNLWSELAFRVDKFVEENNALESQLLLSQFKQAPQSFQNILCLLGAESSRRRGRKKETHQIMKICDNPVFHYLWDAWCSRLSKNPMVSV